MDLKCELFFRPGGHAVGVFSKSKNKTIMKMMYRAVMYSGNIKEIEVKKVTAHTVTFINDDKKLESERKATNYHGWFESKNDAKQWLISHFENGIKAAQRKIEHNQSLIKKVNEQ